MASEMIVFKQIVLKFYFSVYAILISVECKSRAAKNIFHISTLYCPGGEAVDVSTEPVKLIKVVID